MPLIRERRNVCCAIYLTNGAIFTGATHAEARTAAEKSLVFNKASLLSIAQEGWINEKGEFINDKERNTHIPPP
jgi:hypothetical protein